MNLRVAIFVIFLTFVISCNFRQFWPIFVAVSGDLIGHFLYTSNFEIAAVQKYANLVELEKCCHRQMKKAWPASLIKKQILWFYRTEN